MIDENIIVGRNKMEKLIYLTTNPNKVNEANEFFGKKYGFNIEIVNPDFEILVETCREVAAFSAEYGANKLGKEEKEI